MARRVHENSKVLPRGVYHSVHPEELEIIMVDTVEGSYEAKLGGKISDLTKLCLAKLSFCVASWLQTVTESEPTHEP